jgi:hypothetical protein
MKAENRPINKRPTKELHTSSGNYYGVLKQKDGWKILKNEPKEIYTNNNNYTIDNNSDET